MSEPARVEVRRVLPAAAAEVFAAFADAGMVAKWMTPSPEVKLTVLAYDFREGGRYRLAYDVPDGRRMMVSGVYRVVDPPSRIVFSWLIDPPDEDAGIESVVTVTLSPVSRGTELVIRHDGFDRAAARMRHAEGWRGALEHLERLLAGAQG